jgi:hypothetical protein
MMLVALSFIASEGVLCSVASKMTKIMSSTAPCALSLSLFSTRMLRSYDDGVIDTTLTGDTLL